MRFPLLRDGREIVSRVVLVRGFGTLGFLHGPSLVFTRRDQSTRIVNTADAIPRLPKLPEMFSIRI